jgi:riboflavin kinase/FMN adenylyltransferase
MSSRSNFVACKSLADWQSHCVRVNKTPRTVVTIGNFDGVHLGHQEILRRLTDRAHAENLTSVVVTFDPHPLRVLRPEQAPALLLTLHQRLRAFEDAGVDAALVLRFDRHLSELTPENFVSRILVETLRAQAVLVGENFRFGHKHSGDVPLLRELGARFNFNVECIPPIIFRGITVSSTVIRDAVRDGDVALAGRLLGRPYALEGHIVSGDARGSRVVVPTLNLQTPQEILPKLGVYVTEVTIDPQSTSNAKTYRSVTNVGTRPTFSGQHISIESYLFDFELQVVSGPLSVKFWDRLRDEIKFDSPDALRAQIQSDSHRALHFFSLLDSSRHNPTPAE